MIVKKINYLCDWCGNEMSIAEAKELDFIGDIAHNYDVCPRCFKRLKFIMNWKENKNTKLGINFNNDAEITLGKDGAESWNNRYASINSFDDKQAGDVVSSQLHQICKGLAPSFEKMIGAYQGVAFPFELRVSADSLDLKSDENE